jgi:hypothetical protein
MPLDPEPDRFHNAQPAAVEQSGDQLGGVVQQRDARGDFFAGHDHGDVDLLVGAYGIEAARQNFLEDALLEKKAFIARLWVAATRFPWTARLVGKASILGSAGKGSLRDRMPWERTNRTMRSTHQHSV